MNKLHKYENKVNKIRLKTFGASPYFYGTEELYIKKKKIKSKETVKENEK